MTGEVVPAGLPGELLFSEREARHRDRRIRSSARQTADCWDKLGELTNEAKSGQIQLCADANGTGSADAVRVALSDPAVLAVARSIIAEAVSR
jgi:hypothetical protein